MSTTATEAPRRNGVDVATLFATLDAVKNQKEIAKFQFRASNTWVSGTHSRSQVSKLLRRDAGDAAQERHHARRGPSRRCWSDRTKRPTPIEFRLHAIAACLTSGLANVAARDGSTSTR